RVTDRQDGVGPGDLGAVDLDTGTARKEVRAGNHPDVADLNGLGSRIAQLLDGVQQKGRVHLASGVDDGHPDAGAVCASGARKDSQGVESLLCRRECGSASCAVSDQLVTGGLKLACALLQPRGLQGRIVQNGDELALAQRLQAQHLVLTDLGCHGEAENDGQQCREHVGLGGPRACHQPQPMPGGRVAGAAGRLRWWDLAHARNRCLRMEATFEKILMPRTTTTPVESCEPTPSWSPRKTMNAATTTLDRNETTNTLSLKMPSRTARTPPNTVSRAAITAIGR